MQTVEKPCSAFLTWIPSRRRMLDEQHDWAYHNTVCPDLRSHASSATYGLRLLGNKSYAARMTAAALDTAYFGHEQ